MLDVGLLLLIALELVDLVVRLQAAWWSERARTATRVTQVTHQGGGVLQQGTDLGLDESVVVARVVDELALVRQVDHIGADAVQEILDEEQLGV